jgi:YesN/AraC family two-component response regulator
MLRVLLVDDRHDFREAFKESFSDHYPSALVEEAGGGDEALEKIRGTPPHLMFIDIRMPGMNGLQLTRKIKGESPSTRIAILTSYDLPEYRAAALQYGADCFFVKSSLQWDEVVAFAKSIPVEGEP